MPDKRLYRTEGVDAKVFGVCGGIAEYFALDPTIVRVGMVVLGLCASAGVWIYLIAALVIPKKSDVYPGY